MLTIDRRMTHLLASGWSGWVVTVRSEAALNLLRLADLIAILMTIQLNAAGQCSSDFAIPRSPSYQQRRPSISRHAQFPRVPLDNWHSIACAGTMSATAMPVAMIETFI